VLEVLEVLEAAVVELNHPEDFNKADEVDDRGVDMDKASSASIKISRHMSCQGC